MSVDHVDPRAPRFAAGITAALLAVAVFLALVGTATASGTTITQRIADPAFILIAVIAALFAWGVIAPKSAPWGVLFRRLVRPRLSPPTELEDSRPPRFAQAVGFVVVTIGLVSHVLGVPFALPIAAGAAFIAAFLNVAFGFCLGCELYLLGARLRARAVTDARA